MGNGIIITRTPDNLTAFAQVTGQRGGDYPGRDEILLELRQQGIVFGIKSEAIDGMIAGTIIEKQITVAQGIPPELGKDGRVELLIDLSAIGKPRALADGRVDFHDICYVVNVHKDDELAKRVPPVPGKDGRSVLGTPIPAPLPVDPHFSAGTGTKTAPSDPNMLLAAIDGGFWMEHDGTFEVHSEKTISSDIDYKTGDVQFAGNLTVNGTVRSGFSVETKGSLFIGGSVEDCSIKCRGNLVIKGGAFGGGVGTINCKGSVKARHVEHFNVYADGTVTVAEDIVHGMIIAGKTVVARSIIGGMVASAVGVEAETIGTEAEIKTVIDIGKKYERLQQRHLLLSRLAALTTELGNDRERVFEFVRNNLDEGGNLSYDNEKVLAAMKRKSLELHRTYSETQSELEEIDNINIEGEEPYVQAGRILPNTLVKFGIGEQLLRETLEKVRLLPKGKENVMTLSRETTAR